MAKQQKQQSAEEQAAVAATLAEQQWREVDLPGGDEGEGLPTAEWVDPGPGTVLKGTLVRAFVMKDQLGGPKAYRVGYVYADERGDEWTFGEKGGFRQAFRAMNIGQVFELTFVKKDAMKDRNGNPGPKTVWRTRLRLGSTGSGKSVMSELKLSHAQLVASGADLPF
jgi:hypothetical protein